MLVFLIYMEAGHIMILIQILTLIIILIILMLVHGFGIKQMGTWTMTTQLTYQTLIITYMQNNVVLWATVIKLIGKIMNQLL